ncbi:hypothetical protein RRG08_042184 [Elysia crispata]|uniref:Parvovirus non-structural protein 1 helicase domain-containing protein n=1 Tax=Elysia crispata TaxID=231223 RepID=A0AAE0YHD6_9GAST|nr:hypothetical protein RRG08_042184 [Elysia crispata]
MNIFFNDPAPSTSIIDYLEIVTGDHEVDVCQRPIDAWNTNDFYLDGSGQKKAMHQYAFSELHQNYLERTAWCRYNPEIFCLARYVTRDFTRKIMVDSIEHHRTVTQIQRNRFGDTYRRVRKLLDEVFGAVYIHNVLGDGLTAAVYTLYLILHGLDQYCTPFAYRFESIGTNNKDQQIIDVQSVSRKLDWYLTGRHQPELLPPNNIQQYPSLDLRSGTIIYPDSELVIHGNIQAQPQAEEDLRDDLRYFFPTLSEEIIPETPQESNVMETQDVSSAMNSFIHEVYCDVDPDHMASQTVPFDHVVDQNPWKDLDAKWPGASKWAVDNPAPWAFCRLDFTKDKGFRWVDNLCRMKDKEYPAALFIKDCPKPTKRAKLVRKQNNMWQWRRASILKQVYDTNGEPKRHSLHGFLINSPMDDDELLTTPVLKWITPGQILKNMTFESKSLINKIKEFVNSNQVAVWLHDTDIPDDKCHARKGPHFHLIVESTTPNSRNLKNFRALQTSCSKWDCGLYVTKVTTSPDKLYLYQLQDSEKVFLGTNSSFCLETITALQHVDGQVDGFNGTAEFDSDADVLSTVNPALLKQDARAEKRAASSDAPPAKRSKNTDNLYLLKRCIEENPDVGSLQEMVTIYKNTENYQTLCDIFFDQRAEKYWAMAQQEAAGQSQDADILRRLEELPDSLRHMMTPEQTLALFNSWCKEQNINARALAWIMIACLQARIYKKIGVYLQGASNSGKTYWTSTLFQPMNKLVGKMTTGGRFCLQDCVNKRIIIGEEVGIAADNVDRMKELMSGERTTFERKMRAPGTCKANLVLLNSNNLPFANVPQEKTALENRMFLSGT